MVTVWSRRPAPRILHPVPRVPNRLTAARTGAAGVAFAAGAAADQSELATFAAWVAFVAFEARQADPLVEGLGDHG